MRELLTAVDIDLTGGEWLTSDEYSRDFAQRDARVVDRDSWKLERRQHFQEESNASWEAMRRGDWEESLRLIESRRERLLRIEQEENARGHFFHRIRIVEQPLTAYMQWELHSLRLRDECGERIRVMDVEKVTPLERRGHLPEMVVLGGQTLYEVRYTDDGIAEGAFRHTAPDIVAHYDAFLRRLHHQGEEIQAFFDREVAHLPPPSPEPRAE